MKATKTDPGEQLSPEKLAELLAGMQTITSKFYYDAFRLGNHAFVEFCGLMGEYVKMCRIAAEDGRDFTQANTHSGKPLFKMEKYHAEYLGEKFGCIFEPCFGRRWEMIEAFIWGAFKMSRREIFEAMLAGNVELAELLALERSTEGKNG